MRNLQFIIIIWTHYCLCVCDLVLYSRCSHLGPVHPYWQREHVKLPVWHFSEGWHFGQKLRQFSSVLVGLQAWIILILFKIQQSKYANKYSNQNTQIQIIYIWIKFKYNRDKSSKTMIEFLLINLNPVQEYFPHEETSNCQWRESKCTVFHGDPSKNRGSHRKNSLVKPTR